MSLHRSPVIDSDELAALRHRELKITHERARSLGVSALAAIREGRYVADDGQVVDWKFRRDDGQPLAQPWSTSFVTCAAPYAPRVGQPRSGDLLEHRIRRVLAVAHAFGFDTLVLGAWGCGAFGNDPARTAADFRAALEGDFDGAFQQVTFAITDWSPERTFLGPFRDAFSLGA